MVSYDRPFSSRQPSVIKGHFKPDGLASHHAPEKTGSLFSKLALPQENRLHEGIVLRQLLGIELVVKFIRRLIDCLNAHKDIFLLPPWPGWPGRGKNEWKLLRLENKLLVQYPLEPVNSMQAEQKRRSVYDLLLFAS